MGNLWSYRSSKSGYTGITDYDPIDRFTELDEEQNTQNWYTKLQHKYRNLIKRGTRDEKEKLHEKS